MEILPYSQRQKSSPKTLFSGDIRIAGILFAAPGSLYRYWYIVVASTQRSL